MRNFGKIKNFFNKIISEGVSNNDNNKKALFKEYIKILKKDDILKEEFTIYTEIENTNIKNDLLITEKIKKLLENIKKYDKIKIMESNNKLVKLLENNGYENIDDGYDLKDLHENITNLIFEDNDVNVYINSLNECVKYIKDNNVLNENKINGIGEIPNKILCEVAARKFNDKYSNLNEDEKKVVKTIIHGSNEDKKNLFNEILNETISLVNQTLDKTNDIDIKEPLLKAKERLLNSKFLEDNFENDIIKMIDLKKSLSQ